MSAPEPRRAIVVTRRSHGRSALARLAAAHDLAVWWRPVLATRPHPGAFSRLRRLLDERAFDWVVVTSAEAAPTLADAWRRSRVSRSATPPKIAAVGPATARRLRALKMRVDLVGPGPGGAALARAVLTASGARQPRILWPRAARAHGQLAATLRRGRARVIDVVVYRTIPTRGPAVPSIERAVRTGRVAAMCFTAPSAVRAVFARLDADARAALRRAPIGSMGPATSGELRRWQVIPDVEVAGGDVAAAVGAILEFAAARGRARAS